MIRALTLALICFASPLLAEGKLSAGEQAAAIQAVRDYALRYTKSLPNYTCTLTTREVANPPNAGNKSVEPVLTKVEEQLSFLNGREIRKIMRIDGRPAAPDAGDQLKETTEGEFGALLDEIFEPVTGAELAWDRSATLNKRKMDVIAFRVPAARGYVLNGSKGSVRAPFTGLVYADAQTHAVMRLQMKCVMIPPDFEMQEFNLTLDYKAVQVAGHETILPFHFVLNYSDFADDRQHNDDGQYSGYHEFSADATLEFEGAKQ